MQNHKNSYDSILSNLNKLEVEVLRQLVELADNSTVTLANPIEHRVKTYQSIEEKFQRKSLAQEATITDIDDLVGFRMVLLFKRDVETINQLIIENFNVIESEDTSERLSEVQFGYQSHHYICTIPATWASLPTFSELNNIRFEIQIRTSAQHIWAAASHKLQYKQESAVPITLKRSIHRVAALLETVDLEFERVLNENDEYSYDTNDATPNTPLDLFNVRSILSDHWPKENLDEDGEAYSSLIDDLQRVDINTTDKLKQLICDNRESVLNKDKDRVKAILDGTQNIGPDETYSRPESGVYFNHVGLTRMALTEAFQESWRKINQPG